MIDDLLFTKNFFEKCEETVDKQDKKEYIIVEHLK